MSAIPPSLPPSGPPSSPVPAAGMVTVVAAAAGPGATSLAGSSATIAAVSSPNDSAPLAQASAVLADPVAPSPMKGIMATVVSTRTDQAGPANAPTLPTGTVFNVRIVDVQNAATPPSRQDSGALPNQPPPEGNRTDVTFTNARLTRQAYGQSSPQNTTPPAGAAPPPAPPALTTTDVPPAPSPAAIPSPPEEPPPADVTHQATLPPTPSSGPVAAGEANTPAETNATPSSPSSPAPPSVSSSPPNASSAPPSSPSQGMAPPPVAPTTGNSDVFGAFDLPSQASNLASARLAGQAYGQTLAQNANLPVAASPWPSSAPAPSIPMPSTPFVELPAVPDTQLSPPTTSEPIGLSVPMAATTEPPVEPLPPSFEPGSSPALTPQTSPPNAAEPSPPAPHSLPPSLPANLPQAAPSDTAAPRPMSVPAASAMAQPLLESSPSLPKSTATAVDPLSSPVANMAAGPVSIAPNASPLPLAAPSITVSVGSDLTQIAPPGSASAMGEAVEDSATAASTPTITSLPSSLTGVVASNTHAGLPLLQTSLGLLSLETATALPAGAVVTLEPLGDPTLPPFDSDATGPSAPLPGASFAEAIDVLRQVGPQAILPPAGALDMASRLVASLIGLTAAVDSANIRPWLGDKLIKTLEKTGHGGLIERMEKDLVALKAPVRMPLDGAWQCLILPLPLGHRIEPIRLVVRRPPGDDAEAETREEEGTRFLVDVTMSRLGAIQIDGLLRRKTKRFDMILRSHTVLPGGVRHDIEAIFGRSLEDLGMAGGTSFQQTLTFIEPIPMPEPEMSGWVI